MYLRLCVCVCVGGGIIEKEQSNDKNSECTIDLHNKDLILHNIEDVGGVTETEPKREQCTQIDT